MGLYKADFMSGDGGTYCASPLGKFVYDGSVSESTLPYSLYAGGIVVYNNEIHILGGLDNTTKHYKWNGSFWESVSTLPYEFYGGCALVLDNEIHILGSYISNYYTAHYKWNGSSCLQ